MIIKNKWLSEAELATAKAGLRENAVENRKRYDERRQANEADNTLTCVDRKVFNYLISYGPSALCTGLSIFLKITFYIHKNFSYNMELAATPKSSPNKVKK